MHITTRAATHQDLDWIVGELKAFSVFYGTKISIFGDEGHARKFITEMIDKHVVFVAEQESTLIGFIAGLCTSHPYNPDIQMLSETFWWVPEEHRGSRAGAKLLSDFIAHGREHADWITFALEHHSPVKDETLERLGFKLQEKSFLMEVI